MLPYITYKADSSEEKRVEYVKSKQCNVQAPLWELLKATLEIKSRFELVSHSVAIYLQVFSCFHIFQISLYA